MTRTILSIILAPLLAAAVGLLFMGISRKIMARIHWRYGPPLLQPVIDIIRLLTQRGFSHGGMFDLGLVLSLAGAVTVVLFIPFGGWCALCGSGGLLVILYLMLLMPLGIALSGGAGGNPNTSIGISRKLILALGYEVPFLFIVLAVMDHYGTISLARVVELQRESGWALFSWPLCVPGAAYLLILPAVMGTRPFDMAGAPQEISSGPMVEYAGQYLALAHLQHAFAIFVALAMFVNMFLGGAPEPVTFILKMLVVFTGGVLVHASFPRFRVEQAIGYLWRWPTALAFLGLVATVASR